MFMCVCVYTPLCCRFPLIPYVIPCVMTLMFPTHRGALFQQETVCSHILFVPVPVTSSLMGNYFRPSAEAMLLRQPPTDWFLIVLSFHKHFKVRFPCLNNALQSHEKRRVENKRLRLLLLLRPFSGDERGTDFAQVSGDYAS